MIKWFISLRISGMCTYLHYLPVDCCPHFCCCYHNVSTIVPSGLHQIHVNPGNLQGISNWIIDLIDGGWVDCSSSTGYVKGYFALFFFYYYSVIASPVSKSAPPSPWNEVTFTISPNSQTNALIHFSNKVNFIKLGYCLDF